MVKGRMRDSLRQLIARCTPHQQDSSGTQTQTSSSAAPSVSVVPGAADLHPDTETDAPHSSSTEQLETIISAPAYSVDTSADDATRTDSLAPPSQPTASMTAPGNVARWWRENEAFNQLSVAEREILEPSLPHPDYNDTAVALERIRTRIQDAMAAKRDRTWRIKWRGEDIVLHDVGMKIVNWIDKFKQIGDIAVQYDPGHAALLWVAFRFLLEICVNRQNTVDAILIGLEKSSNLIDRCAVYESVYVNSSRTLEKTILQLYTAILKYLAQAVKVSKGNALRGLYIVKELSESLGNIEECEKTVERDAHATGVQYVAVEFNKLQMFLDELRTTSTRLGDNLTNINHMLEISDRSQILEWLSTIPYINHHTRISEERLEGTGEWLLGKKEYRGWRASSASKLLLLRGIPGAGKTYMASKVIDTIVRELIESNTTEKVAYFYCNRAEENRRDPESILNALIQQLVQVDNKRVWKPIVDIYQDRARMGQKSSRLTLQESQEILINLTDIYSQTTICIDGLDEVQRDIRIHLLKSLKLVIAKSKSLVKIFATSRNDPDILKQFSAFPKIDVQPDDYASDIEMFIKSKIERTVVDEQLLFGTANYELQHNICDVLATRCKGMFQLAAVHITFLCQMDTEEDIRASLKDLPDTLTKAYDEIYKGILEQKGSAPQLALNALRWVKFSYEPLASDTLLDAVIMAQVSKTGDYPASQSITNDTILKVCQNLLVLDDRLQIYRFAHLSVDEYLETKFNNSKVDSHAYIAESCLSLLCSPKPFEKYDQTIFTKEGQYANRHILLYSAAFWPWHFVRYEELKLENGHSEVLERLWERFMMQSNYQKWLNYHYAVIKTEGSNKELFWQKLHAFANEQSPDDRIYATCIFGLSRRFKVLFELRRNVLATEISVGKLLCYAARFGYVELIQYLLANKADVSAVGENRSTPLHFASENGHEEVAQLLLDKGANVSTTNNYGWTPLHLASQNGHEVARLLLEMDANVSAADNYGWTPLHFASLNGHEVAGLLLEKGANLSSTDNDGWMPLHFACQNGHETIVQLLLEKGANISAKGENGSTPLHLALQNEQDSVVQLLLDMGADLSAAGDYGWTPLHLALQNGSETVALLLLERGVDFSVSGGYGSTPLHLASQYGYEEVVRKLLVQGASFSAADNYGSTALHLASHHGHEMAARLLLNMDANLSTTDNHGLTPLHLASQNRQAAVTQLLLDNGASISSTSNFGWTPLHFACQNGSEEVARLLIENGANIDIADDNGLTPLHLSLRNGHKVVAKLLLQKSACADVSAAKTNGLASLNLHEEVA